MQPERLPNNIVTVPTCTVDAIVEQDENTESKFELFKILAVGYCSLHSHNLPILSVE